MCEVSVSRRSEAILKVFSQIYESLDNKFGNDHWILNNVNVEGDENPNFWD